MVVEEGVALRLSKMQEREDGSNDNRHGKAERGKMEGRGKRWIASRAS
jgi:hypothetical protein